MLETARRGRFLLPRPTWQNWGSMGEAAKTSGSARSDTFGMQGWPTFRISHRATGVGFIFRSSRQQQTWATGADGFWPDCPVPDLQSRITTVTTLASNVGPARNERQASVEKTNQNLTFSFNRVKYRS